MGKKQDEIADLKGAVAIWKAGFYEMQKSAQRYKELAEIRRNKNWELDVELARIKRQLAEIQDEYDDGYEQGRQSMSGYKEFVEEGEEAYYGDSRDSVRDSAGIVEPEHSRLCRAEGCCADGYRNDFGGVSDYD